MHARRVVGHDIQRAREVVGLMEVPVLSLVGALDVAEVGRCGVTRHGAFGDP